ncbi:TPA: hypothetical protein TY768_000891 [Streptococcus suis]|nr:hypothetical protein [Streptococcus suis]
MKNKKFIAFLGLSLLLTSACSTTDESTVATTGSTAETVSQEDYTIEEYFDELVNLIEPVTTDNYNSDDYLFHDYKTILRDPEKFFGIKIGLINLEIIQIIEEGKYTKLLGYTPNDDLYMLFIETNRLETKLLEDDVLHVNGRYVFDMEYETQGGSDKTVPLIYIDAYLLLD